MEGFSCNTYSFINRAGISCYLKFHWKPTCGVRCFLDDEAAAVCPHNRSHATQDLYDSIAAGSYPEWKLFVQVMDPDVEDRYDFDPLDDTKTWPEDILPLQPVGRLVLNLNIDNFFAENEQLAFGPGLVVPGIDYSDGPKNFLQRTEEVDYYPSRHAPYPSRHAPLRHADRVPLTGKRDKIIIQKQNDFKQPGERYRSWAPDRQERFIRRWVEALGHPKVSDELRSIWCDSTLGQKVGNNLNIKPNM